MFSYKAGIGVATLLLLPSGPNTHSQHMGLTHWIKEPQLQTEAHQDRNIVFTSFLGNKKDCKTYSPILLKALKTNVGVKNEAVFG